MSVVINHVNDINIPRRCMNREKTLSDISKDNKYIIDIVIRT